VQERLREPLRLAVLDLPGIDRSSWHSHKP